MICGAAYIDVNCQNCFKYQVTIPPAEQSQIILWAIAYFYLILESDNFSFLYKDFYQEIMEY